MIRFQRSVIFVIAALLIIAAPVARFARQGNPQDPAPASPQQNPKPQDPKQAEPKTQDPNSQDRAAQPPSTTQTKQDVVRINTQLVQVDAVVTDKNGKHVEDLTEDDFELLVDGKKQTISHFMRINLPMVKREPAAKKKSDPSYVPDSMPTRQIGPAEVRRTIAFIVDDLGLSPSSMALARESLKTFLREQMQDGDLVAIIRTGNGLGMLEQFTSDKRILFTAAEKLIWNPLSRDMMPSFADASTEQTDDQADAQAVLDDFDDFQETSFTTGTLGAINFVVRGLRSMPGRKSVILLSDGFRINSKTNNDNSSMQILQRLQNLAEQASRSSVVIYAIDAKGIQPFMPGASVAGRPADTAHSDALQTAQEALEGPTNLALQTGGFIVTNTNDLNIGFEEALYDQQSYYLLGFDPEDATFDRKYHSIKLHVKRPGLKVRTRSGFFGVNEGERPEPPKTRGQQIFSAMLSPMGAHDLSLRMTPYFFNALKGGPLVRALFHIDCSKLTFKDAPNGQKHLNLNLVAFVFDEEGTPIDLAVRRLALDFDEKRYREVLAEGLAYRADFQMRKPGAYQFRAVLRDDESGKTGSATQFIQAPDLSKNRLAMSGVVLTTPKNAPAVIPAAANGPASPVVAPVASVAPPERDEKESDGSSVSANPLGLQATAYVRRFPRTGFIQYGAAIYNASVDKKTGQPQITVQAEIYRPDGILAYRLPSRALELSRGANPKRFDYVGRLQLNNFPAGDYKMRLIVTDGLARKKFSRVDQWMDFSVQ
jgi:VWFA-related protein